MSFSKQLSEIFSQKHEHFSELLAVGIPLESISFGASGAEHSTASLVQK